ncbi:hypothetical protein [Streptomyces tailanensis]|uniref:hypothetical protein n=1 Tax=Streptomyces tailanensis TaxID=2569858 RepID=UPI001C0EF4C1|nr:hypothetical protein [Streptomyces tailanensis]
MDKGDAITGQLLQATTGAKLVWEAHEEGAYRTTVGDFTFSVEEGGVFDDTYTYILRISSEEQSEIIRTRTRAGDRGSRHLDAQVNEELKLLYVLARESASGRPAFFDKVHGTLVDLLTEE